MRPVLLAVDVSNQVWKAVAVNPSLESQGRYTGGLYGFIVALQKAIRISGATALVLCRDTKPYKRSTLYPEYKALRAGNRDPEMVERVEATMPLIKQLAEANNWPMWSIPGFESDDLIAHCVTQHRHRFERIVAMSNDSDLYQLFKWGMFSIYKGGKHGIYDVNDYGAEWGIDPAIIPLILSLSGTHNEVEGIANIGPVNAKRIALDPLQLRSTRERYAHIIDRNLELIRLPHAEFPRDVQVPKCGVFRERTFLRFCAHYDINAHQAACEAFSQVSPHA